MIIILLILLILVAGLPWTNSSVSNLAVKASLTRFSSVTIIFSSFLIMNIFYINQLHDGLSIFSGFFYLSAINQSFQILLLIIGGLILASIVSNRYLLLSSINGMETLSLNKYFSLATHLASQVQLLLNNNSALSKKEGSLMFSPNQDTYIINNNYSLIIIFNLLGACFLINTSDLLTLYIAVETQSFALYILSTLKNDSVNSASAGLKYFLIGSLASTLILLGIALLYYATGLTNFESMHIYLNITDFCSHGYYKGGYYEKSPYDDIMYFWNFAEFNPFYTVIILGFIFIITGIFIKLGAAPMHQWAPDVYSLVPTPITTWLIIIPKISLFVLLYQILELILQTGNANGYLGLPDISFDALEPFFNFYNLTEHDFAPSTLEYLENTWYTHLYQQLVESYGDATYFYPHYLQIELTNLYGSPIVKYSDYSSYGDSIYSYWGNHDYFSILHNLLFYDILITPLGALTIKQFLIFIAIISLIIGAIGGLYQIKIKRLLAFSAINHIGFLIIALSINNVVSLESFIFYLTQYSLTNLNIFLIIIAFGYIAYIYPSSNTINGNLNLFGMPNKTTDLNFIGQLTGLFKNNSILTISFVICLFSMAGIPPLLGFFAKQQVLLSALSVGFIFVAIVAINTSVISAYYYLKLIQVSTFINTNEDTINKPESSSPILSINSKKHTLTNYLSNNSYSNPITIKHGNGKLLNTNFFNYSNDTMNSNINNYKNSGFINSIINKFNNNSLVLPFNSLSDIDINSSLFNLKSLNFKHKFSNIHSYLISILTLIILLFTLKPNLLLNLTNILVSYSTYMF